MKKLLTLSLYLIFSLNLLSQQRGPLTGYWSGWLIFNDGKQQDLELNLYHREYKFFGCTFRSTYSVADGTNDIRFTIRGNFDTINNAIYLKEGKLIDAMNPTNARPIEVKLNLSIEDGYPILSGFGRWLSRFSPPGFNFRIRLKKVDDDYRECADFGFEKKKKQKKIANSLPLLDDSVAAKKLSFEERQRTVLQYLQTDSSNVHVEISSDDPNSNIISVYSDGQRLLKERSISLLPVVLNFSFNEFYNKTEIAVFAEDLPDAGPDGIQVNILVQSGTKKWNLKGKLSDANNLIFSIEKK